MSAQEVPLPRQNLVPAAEAAAADLIIQDFAFVPGQTLAGLLDLAPGTSDAEWRAFAHCWNRLTRDNYMADHGRYRYRRYGRFEYRADRDSLRLLPHQPYSQPLSVNPLNGGIQRYFDPLEDVFVASPVLQRLLRTMAKIYAAADGYASNWRIRLHPYRILAATEAPGRPTPEGLHRDGVTYIASMLVNRHNLTGGETRVTDTEGGILSSVTLAEPMDLLLSDDETTLHEVSEIHPLDDQGPAYRDVLVIAFERMEALL